MFARPSSGCRPSEEAAWCGGVSGARALRVRVSSAAAAPAPAHARRLSPPPHAHRATTPPRPSSPSNKRKFITSSMCLRNFKLKILTLYPPTAHEELPPSATEAPGTAQLKPVTAVSQLTVASAPVRSAPAQSSYALERRTPKHDHHHRPVETVQPVQVKL